jgi:hypothetical protein
LLADYSESRIFSKATKLETFSKGIGTYMYMAPELTCGEKGFILILPTIIMIIILLDNLFFSLGKGMDLSVIGGHWQWSCSN